MTKYTRENPFEFEGVRAYRFPDGRVFSDHAESGRAEASKHPEAIHAFIEAERTGWHWTNDDHTEARNGRWCGQVDPDGGSAVSHDDFPGSGWGARSSDPDGKPFARNARDKYREFVAWRAEQDQPEEPTGLGAVVEVEWVTGKTEKFTLGDRWRSVDDGDPWEWWQAAKGVRVTVLSEGVSQ